ncbi:MAG TPA: hypothetical protein PLE14_10990, partial [Anaerolineales bacterium]|nr:hypothetical protein [Anaerolineales bacterium]
LLDPTASGTEAALGTSVRLAVADAIGIVFVIALFAAALALATVLFFMPRMNLSEIKSAGVEKPSLPVSTD